MKLKNFLFLPISIIHMGMMAQNLQLNIDGEWNYKLDPEGIGETQKWYATSFEKKLFFPGSLNSNDIGDRVTVKTQWTGSMWNDSWYKSDFYARYREADNTKIVFWLTPNKVYTGKAWYQKKIRIPENWNNSMVLLRLERCHWVSTVWLNEKKIGSSNSLSVPHCYELDGLKPGKDYTLTLCIDNAIRDIQPGVDSHSISDNTQSNWNGIIGKMVLESHPKSYMKNVRIEPLFAEKKIRLTFDISSENSIKSGSQLRICAVSADNIKLPEKSVPVKLRKGTNEISVDYDMSSYYKLWDEFSPNLYKLTACLETRLGIDTLCEQFGLRKLGIKGTQITVNDRPIFLRGTLECCIFPKTGFPPTNEEEWTRIMRICKAHGLNHIRFHSWCPPEVAFDAADKLGMYLYVECASWASDIGSGKPIDNYVYEESRRIVAEYGNHPSFCLMSYGNEPHGKNHAEYLKKFVSYWKARDARFLYTTASGWPVVPESDWHSMQAPRIQGWGQGTKSIINASRPNSVYNWDKKINKEKPTISHEIGQWCVYPDLTERAKYTGVFKAKNFDIFEDRLKDNSLLNLADSFILASGKLQVLCYKADIEAALRTKGFGGFQLLDLHDFPGQGTSLVGVLNPFWESKGYVTPQEYSEFCNQVVPLALMDKFVFKSGETLNAIVKIAQYSKTDMTAPVIWKITSNSDGKLVADGFFKSGNIPTGTLTEIGNISHKINVDTPQQWTLEIEVGGYRNRWSLWAYPDTKTPKGEVMISSVMNDSVEAYLNNGGKVLLTPKLGTIRNEGSDSVAVGFSSIFWNTLWTNGQAPHTLGILCNPKHPALSLFPTEYHSNYQWWDAMSHCNALPLYKLGNPEPIVRIIDDWFKARSLGLIVELKVGQGSLMLCGVDLLANSEKRLEAVQLTNSLLNYMKSSAFNPKSTATVEQVKSLFKK